MKDAVANQKMMFIFFHDATMTAARRAFEEQTLRDPAIFEQLGRYVLLTLPLDASVPIKHEQVKLLDHPAFREMHGRQGVAVLDFQHNKPEIYGYVVSTFPFTSGKYYVPISLSIILDLPPGTLTQRTMIYAVRLHPEKPLSTEGQLSPMLTKEASQHSSHQAAILLQGHHNWDSRFQRISAKLPEEGLPRRWWPRVGPMRRWSRLASTALTVGGNLLVIGARYAVSTHFSAMTSN